MDETRPVQHVWPDLTCFGCGPANPDGIHLESYLDADGETLLATVDPYPRFSSGAPNVADGGFVASLVDCHSIWTAIAAAHRRAGLPLEDSPRVAFVTGRLAVEFRAPTPPRPADRTAGPGRGPGLPTNDGDLRGRDGGGRDGDRRGRRGPRAAGGVRGRARHVRLTSREGPAGPGADEPVTCRRSDRFRKDYWPIPALSGHGRARRRPPRRTRRR